MKNLPPRWKYGLVAILTVLGISSAASSYTGVTHSLIAQPKTNQTTTIDEQVKGTQAPTNTPTPEPTAAPSPSHILATPTAPYISPTLAPVQQSIKQSNPVYSDEDKDCSDFATHTAAQAFFEAVGTGDPHRLDRDGDGIACEDLP
jgi:hypothetical protein